MSPSPATSKVLVTEVIQAYILLLTSMQITLGESKPATCRKCKLTKSKDWTDKQSDVCTKTSSWLFRAVICSFAATTFHEWEVRETWWEITARQQMKNQANCFSSWSAEDWYCIDWWCSTVSCSSSCLKLVFSQKRRHIWTHFEFMVQIWICSFELSHRHMSRWQIVF